MEDAAEPTIEETICLELKPVRRPKKKGQKEEDLKEFPQEEIPHDVPEEELIKTFGESNYKSMPDANSHFPRPAGPHFPASQGHIKRSALEIGRARGAPPC